MSGHQICIENYENNVLPKISICQTFLTIINNIKSRLAIRRLHRTLAELSDHQLKDIGISRAKINRDYGVQQESTSDELYLQIMKMKR